MTAQDDDLTRALLAGLAAEDDDADDADAGEPLDAEDMFFAPDPDLAAAEDDDDGDGADAFSAAGDDDDEGYPEDTPALVGMDPETFAAKTGKVLKEVTVRRNGKTFKQKRYVNVQQAPAAKKTAKAEPAKKGKPAAKAEPAKKAPAAKAEAPKKTAGKKAEPTAEGKAKAKAKEPPRVEQKSPSDKALRAKEHYKATNAEEQQYAEDVTEPRMAKELGGASFPDAEPCDLKIPADAKKAPEWTQATLDYHKELRAWKDRKAALKAWKDGGQKGPKPPTIGPPPEMKALKGKVKHLTELKTVITGGNGKLTMDAYAMVRKVNAEREHGCPYHTIAIDDREIYDPTGNHKDPTGRRVYYYRRGIAGSAYLLKKSGAPNMTRCKSIAEVKKLMAMKDADLPPEARRTDQEWLVGKWVFFQDAGGKGYKNSATGRVVRPKK